MKYRAKTLRIITMTVLFFLCLTAMQTSVFAADKADDSEEKNLERWFKVCSTMGKNLNKKGFRYSYSAKKNTYKAALSSRKANCAKYVSWCLQEYDAVDKGDSFYVMGSGRIKKNFSKWDSRKVKVIKVYKKCRSVKLKPGDIVCWAGRPHTNIYAGRNSSGTNTWFDAGRNSTYGKSNGSRYKVIKAKASSYWSKRKISYIIRIKDLA